MKNKKILILAGIGLALIIIFSYIYWLFFSKPTSFPTDDQLIEQINEHSPSGNVKTIQDQLVIDDKHVVVPFISEDNNYSLSFWVWEMHQWKMDSIQPNGELKLWKIRTNDPSSYQFVWNIHPDDQISSLSIYLLRDRDYRVTNGIERYYPNVQMSEKIDINDKTYGMLSLPAEWELFMNELGKVELQNQNSLFSGMFLSNYSMYFGWTVQDESQNVIYPERTVYGNFTSSQNSEYVMFLDERQIEKLSPNEQSGG